MANFTFNSEAKNYELRATFTPAQLEGTLTFSFSDSGQIHPLTGECQLIPFGDDTPLETHSFTNEVTPSVTWDNIPFGIYSITIEASRHDGSGTHPTKMVGVYMNDFNINLGNIVLDPIELIMEYSSPKINLPSYSLPPTIVDKILVWVAQHSIFIKFEAQGQNPITSIKVWKGEALPKHINDVPKFDDDIWEKDPSIENTYYDELINFYDTITNNLEAKSYFIKLEITDSTNQSFRFVYPNVLPIGDYKTLTIQKHPNSLDIPIYAVKINDESKSVDFEYEYAMGSKIKLQAIPFKGYKFEFWDKMVNNQPSKMEIYEDTIYISLKQDTVFYCSYSCI